MHKYPYLLRNILRRFEADWHKNSGPRGSEENWWFQQYKEWVAAVRFLSTLPWPGSTGLFTTYEPDPRLIIGSGYFSLVGMLLALLLSLLPFLLGRHLPSLVLAAILLVAQILLTGGLHLDGLMDSCDGLFSGRDVERKLEIMRDSRVGSFGVLGAGCVLLVKFACYASLSVQILPLVLLSVLPSARWAMLLAVYLFPCARPAGLGAAFRQSVTLPRLVCTGLLALIFALIWGHLAGLFIWIGATVSALLIGIWITRMLGGLTGDSYGGIEEVTECIVFILTFFVLPWF